MDRLQRFRAAIKNVGSTAAEGGVRDELIVAHEDFMRGSEIAGRLELDPSARVLVVGGIGTGKSTQVAAAARRLEQSMLVVRIAEDRPQADRATDELTENWAPTVAFFGQVMPQILRSPWSGTTNESELVAQVRANEAARSGVRVLEYVLASMDSFGAACARWPICIVVDGKDRMTLNQFCLEWSILHRGLVDATCGTIVVGPPDFPFGQDIQDPRFVSQQFVFIEPLPVQQKPAARAALIDILQRRLADLVAVDRDALGMIVDLSSGVVRDALHLLELALNHAFSVGRDSVTIRSVEIAHEEYVRSRLFGLSASAGARLRERLNSRAWTLCDDDERYLYRRGLLVAQYDEEKRLSYVVHAAIAPMLPKVAA